LAKKRGDTDVLKPTTDRRIRRTRQCLQEALLSLLKDRSYADITVQDISNRADFNRVTFYAHYRDKDDLLTDIIEGKLNGLIDCLRVSRVKGTEVELESGVNPWTLQLFDYIYQHAEFFQIFYLDNKVPGFFGMLYNVVWRYFHEEVQIQGSRSGGTVELNQEMYNDYMTAAILGVIGYWIKTGFTYSAKYMAEQLTEIVHNRPHRLLIR